MPKKGKPVDDLDEELEGEDEVEEADDEEEESDEEAEEDEEETEEESDEEEADEDEKKPAKAEKRGRGRPKGSSNAESKPMKKGKLIGIVLLNGIPKRVHITKVMGRNVRACKVGEKNPEDNSIRIPIAEVFEYEEEIFNKMKERAEKIKRLIDANISDAANRLRPIASPRKSARKGNPLDAFD